MRRAFVLLAVAGGLAAVFATASHGRPAVPVVREFGKLVVISTNETGCSIAQSRLLVPGPIAFSCRTHREAERLVASLRGQAGPGLVASVRGRRVVVP